VCNKVSTGACSVKSAYQWLQGLQGAELVASEAETLQVDETCVLQGFEPIRKVVITELQLSQLWQLREAFQRGEPATIQSQRAQIDELFQAGHFVRLARIKYELSDLLRLLPSDLIGNCLLHAFWCTCEGTEGRGRCVGSEGQGG
jgi:hypothetical protein